MPVITGANASTQGGTGTAGTAFPAGDIEVVALAANEPVTWALAGTGAGLFNVSSSSNLTPKAPGISSVYIVEITATDDARNVSGQ